MRPLAVLSMLLVAVAPCTGSAQAQPAPSSGLSITVLKGDTGRNSIKTRTGIPIEIEVRDPENRTVAGAQVIVQLPSSGASGSFPGGQLTKRTVTGPAGQAVITGFVPNDIEGRFNVKITADSGTLSGSVVVSQVNVAMLEIERPKSHKGLWVLLAAGAGGAVAAATLAGGSGGSGSSAAASAPSVTVIPGTVTVGGPR